MDKLLPREFYYQDTEEVAKRLLGKMLCFRNPGGDLLRGKITETEAYLGIEDAACHTFGGRRTDRTKSMYLDGGHSYIYMIYGMYFCLNVVTKTSAHPEAVLIRALEPVSNAGFSSSKDSAQNALKSAEILETKNLPSSIPTALKKKDLKTNGPGKLCREWGFTKAQDGLELWKKKSGLWILDAEDVGKKDIISRPRIGVDYAGLAAAWPLRFYIKDNPYVSKA